MYVKLTFKFFFFLFYKIQISLLYQSIKSKYFGMKLYLKYKLLYLKYKSLKIEFNFLKKILIKLERTQILIKV